jgi:purine-nucleoside phosphorylase
MTTIITKHNICEAAGAIRAAVPGCAPRAAVVLGSGMQSFGDAISDAVELPYTEVPHTVPSTAPGHKGRFLFGEVGGVPIVCMQGRLHAYEGYSADQIAFPVFVMKELGVERLVVTNAAGGIDPSFEVGDVMLIDDQINMLGMDPCTGWTDPQVGPRFFDMTRAFSPEMKQAALDVAGECGVTLHRGVYIAEPGPSFETPAEIRAYAAMGADAVGMSTVLEVVAAANQQIPTLGLSLISNPAAGVVDEPLDMDDVAKAAAVAAGNITRLVVATLARLFSDDDGK